MNIKAFSRTGKPLVTCECNFENLFANWGPRFVTNCDSVELVSCKFVETLADYTGRIGFYAIKISDFKNTVYSTQRGRNYSVEDGIPPV
jgi:uncharacterized protein YbaR (Trm112 family)